MLEICKITVKVIPNPSPGHSEGATTTEESCSGQTLCKDLVNSPNNGPLAIGDTGYPEPFAKNAQVHLQLVAV